jgi:dipeptidyl aminopeptidase/acylaminoacyl peptidase
MSGDERRNYEKIQEWSDGEVGELELAASPTLLKAISPIYHLDRVSTPISVHHGSADTVVPPEWSADLCQRLTDAQHPVECHAYLGMPHTFSGASDDLFMRRVVAFFDRH